MPGETCGANHWRKGQDDMLEFNRQRYLDIQSGALALAPAIDVAVCQVLKNGCQNLFFVGTGGAAILMHPAAQWLQRASGLKVYTEVAAELVVGGHAQLGPHSLVVVPSLSGTTKESVELATICRERGATVIALLGRREAPLAQAANHALVNFAEDDTSCESFYLQGLLIALSALRVRNEIANADAILGELERLPELLAGVKDEFEVGARAMADRMVPESYQLITAAGNCWPEAWYFGMCILEEMQWIRTRPVHAADFFHGPLELVEKGVSVMVLKGEDRYRPLAERVEDFARRYTDKLLVLDTATFALPGLSPEVRGLVSPMVLASALERVSEFLAARRNHPLSHRRYYKKVSY
jgi:fructoselysine-6-phosphate deglycase